MAEAGHRCPARPIEIALAVAIKQIATLARDGNGWFYLSMAAEYVTHSMHLYGNRQCTAVQVTPLAEAEAR